MKKLLFCAGLAFSGLAMAQYGGRVGITTVQPYATLDIEKNTNTKLNGILIPRVSKTEAQNMGGGTNTDALKESTLVYIDDTSGTGGNITGKVDSKGFYYYSGTEWVKLGTGATSAAPATPVVSTLIGNIRKVNGIKSSEWKNDDFTIMVSVAVPDLQLPDPTSNAGRIISVRNLTSTSKSFNGNWTPVNNSTIGGYRGMLLQAFEGNWYVIGGF